MKSVEKLLLAEHDAEEPHEVDVSSGLRTRAEVGVGGYRVPSELPEIQHARFVRPDNTIWCVLREAKSFRLS